MTNRLLLLATAGAVLFAAEPARAVCSTPPLTTETWTAQAVDQVGQTTWSITAPCKVLFDTPFEIVLQARDLSFPDQIVGGSWSLVDTPTGGTAAVVASGALVWTTAGLWEVRVPMRYTIAPPVDHGVQFSFRDLGRGGGAHDWSGGVTGGIVVDPFPNAPPTVDAGPDLAVASADASSLAIAGSAADPDGDALSYRWLAGTAELQPARAVEASGAAPLDAAAVAGLPIGAHALVLEVSDGEHVATDGRTLTVEDTPPVAIPFAGGTVQSGELVVLAASVSDFDGGVLAYRWLEGTRELAAGTAAVPAGGAAVPLPAHVLVGLPLGAHELTLAVSDGPNAVAAVVAVTVVDTLAPTLAPVASVRTLWPPNGRMVPVTIAAHAHDGGGGPVSLTADVASAPAAAGGGQEDEAAFEILGVDDAKGEIVVALRATRDPRAGDRTYTIAVTATDLAGNASSASVPVVVPRRGPRADPPSDR